MQTSTSRDQLPSQRRSDFIVQGSGVPVQRKELIGTIRMLELRSGSVEISVQQLSATVDRRISSFGWIDLPPRLPA